MSYATYYARDTMIFASLCNSDNEVSLEAVDSCASLLKGSRRKCGIHQSTLQQAAKIWLFCYLILVNVFIIACVRFWTYVYLCTVYFGRIALSQKAPVTFIMSVSTHVSAPIQLDGFPSDWISGTVMNICREIPDFQIWLKSDTLYEGRSP